MCVSVQEQRVPVVVEPAAARTGAKGGAEVAPSERTEKPTRYSILSQSEVELRDPENSPSVSLWGFLVASEQTGRLSEISIYAERGKSLEAIRLLYLNDLALEMWRQMKKPATVTGRLQRPPRSAVLAFGMPFSE